MGFLLDEKKMMNETAFIHEERMGSQYARFLDKSPTYSTYYHINNIESTADNGFQSVERVLGGNSPIRFNEVKNFPIYGVEQILLNLSDELQGMDSSYEGEAVILPNTVKPLPNDMFTIDYLDQNYLFMVTEIAYDTIKSNNFYKITFTVKSLDGDDVENIKRQCSDKFTAVVSNVGTKEKCIVRDDDFQLLLELDDIYRQIAERYKMMFFNSKYNSFLYTNSIGKKVYDKYLTQFINQYQLFTEKKDFNTLHFVIEDKEQQFLLNYHDSIYRAVELQKKNLVKPFKYTEGFVGSPMSIFSFYRDATVRSVLFEPYSMLEYIPSAIVENLNSETPEFLDMKHQLIHEFFNDSIKTVYDISLDDLRDYFTYMGFDKDTFTLIPIVLYILRFYSKKLLSTK